jgi:glucokinase
MYQIGFDVGGTNIAVGLVDDEMRIVQRSNIKFPTGEKYNVISAYMAAEVKKLLLGEGIDEKVLSCIGIAIPGSIDANGETIINAYNLQFHNVPFRQAMQVHFPKVPVYLANDANAATLAELHAGAFKGCNTAVLITLGTGVGGGLILGGRMFNGGMGNGVELGHMIMNHYGDICSCGNVGCIETLCTATWLIQQGRKAVVEHFNSMIYTEANGDMENVTARLVIDCARAGDSIAMDIFKRYVDSLGSVVASFINLLDPEVIALGGGVSLAGEFLLEPLRANVADKVLYKKYGSIVSACLGNDAGIIGAAMLHRNKVAL